MADSCFSQERFPHCDAAVLHAPNECKYCDMFPDQQQKRIDNKVNFTGEKDQLKSKCPAEIARPEETINSWGGNTPRSPYQDHIDFLAKNENEIE